MSARALGERSVMLRWEGPLGLDHFGAFPEQSGVYAWVLRHERFDRVYVGSARNVRTRLARHVAGMWRGKEDRFDEANLSRESICGDWSVAGPRRIRA